MKSLKDFKILTDSAISLLKKNADDFSKRFSEIDMFFPEKSFNKIGESFKAKFNELMKRIKDMTDCFIVEVPFDKVREKLSFRIENNKLTVVTELNLTDENLESKSTTEIVIPNNVDENSLIQKYDEDKKIMKFIFRKNTSTTDEVKNEQTETDTLESNSDVKQEETLETIDKIEKKKQLLEKMIRMHESGISYRKIAEETGISDKTVKRWIKSALKQE